jgi:RNA polymerase sigma-70 factor (ECF subfamily)
VTLNDAEIDGLLQQARTGDEMAAARLIAGVRDRVFRWALVITRDSDDAEDVTQQVSMTLHRKLHEFEGRSRFTTWLYMVARNTAIDMTTKASRRYEQQMDQDAIPQPLSDDAERRITQFDNARAAALVRAFFSELPTRQRELIELIDREGFTTGEAAAMMGIEAETARVHLLRARRTLRTKMLATHPEMFT